MIYPLLRNKTKFQLKDCEKNHWDPFRNIRTSPEYKLCLHHNMLTLYLVKGMVMVKKCWSLSSILKWQWQGR